MTNPIPPLAEREPAEADESAPPVTPRAEDPHPSELATGSGASLPRRRGRGPRIDEAVDEATRRELIETANRRRRERIEKSDARQRKLAEKRRTRRRTDILELHFSPVPTDWESPAVRRVLDRVLADARDRRLFLLPPLPHVQMSGIGRTTPPAMSGPE